MIIKVVADTITKAELAEIAKEFYGTMVKGVADIEKGIIAIGGEYHMDANAVLLERGSNQEHVWGFNINLDRQAGGDGWIEYISLINIRPAKGNRSMEIEDEDVRRRVRDIILKKVK